MSRRISQHLRCGWTLIELVVVIAVIALLGSLLMVGIDGSRATSRRVQCQNNMRQIGIATHSYLATRSSLPSPPSGGSFLVYMLPFLEQGQLFDQIRTTTDPFKKGTLFESPAIYLCPSDGDRSNHPDRFKSANYVGNAGTGELRNGLYGVFGNPFRGVRVTEVSDGTSNTALASECLPSANTDNRRKVFHTTSETLDFFELQRQIRLLASLNVSVPTTEIFGRGRPWVDGNLPYTHYHHAMLPNESSGYNGNIVATGLYSASSEHSNGVNLVRLDGSVAFVSNDIDEKVWWSLGSRKTGEVAAD